jgi:quinol monooxygenase YgiN
MVRVTAAIAASSARDARQHIDALRTLMVSTRLEKGCLGCRVQMDGETTPTVRYEEEWETEEDLSRRVCSDAFTSILTLLEAAPVPPVIRFHFVTVTRGLEYVEAVRAGSNPN